MDEKGRGGMRRDDEGRRGTTKDEEGPGGKMRDISKLINISDRQLKNGH